MISSDKEQEVLWRGRPWVTPSIAIRGVVAVIVAALLTWLEYSYGYAGFQVIFIPLIYVTNLLIAALWLISALRHLLLRRSNKYTLRKGSLEVEIGIASTRTFVVSATGFSDLEVITGVMDRILNVGSIIVRSDAGRQVVLKKVRNPTMISSMVRDVMTSPIVRVAPEKGMDQKMDSSPKQ